MKIYINSQDINMPFTGLLMYAVDAKENKVGNFITTSGSFGTPWDNKSPAHPCAGSILHTSAAKKPYFNTFHFVTPPAGTGKITIRALIKEGVANQGSFHFPGDADLVLEEAAAVTDGMIIESTTNVGQSCSEFCASKGASCDAAALKTIAGDFKTMVMGTKPCALPMLSSCTAPGLSFGTGNNCYNSCTENIATDDFCSASSTKPADGNRFCVCKTTGGVGGEVGGVGGGVDKQGGAQNVNSIFNGDKLSLTTIAGITIGAVFVVALVAGIILQSRIAPRNTAVKSTDSSWITNPSITKV